MSERDPLDDLPWPSLPEPSQAAGEKIRHDCSKGLRTAECASARRRAALSMLFPVVTVGVLSFLAAKYRHVDETFLQNSLYGAVGWSVVLGLTLLVGLASPPGRRPRAALRWAIAVAIPAVFLILLIDPAKAEPFAAFTSGAHAEHAIRCGGICFVVGAIMSSGVMLLWRGTDPLTPGLTGALLGLVGGMGSALGMGIFCPSHETWHVCVSHGVVLASLAVLGGAAGRRLLAP